MEGKAATEEMLCTYEYGIERGEQMASFVNDNVGNLANKRGLDLGCGLGGISIAFARECDYLVSGDIIIDRIGPAKKRFEELSVGNISSMCIDSLSLCFKDNSFDFVIMNGLIEWVGTKPGKETPTELQKLALTEVRRILKNDGFVYIATENRWYPSHFIKDPHVHMPLVAVVPRWLANAIASIYNKNPYRVYLYSYWKLKKLILESGYNHTKFFLPFFQRPPAYILHGQDGQQSAPGPQVNSHGRSLHRVWLILRRLQFDALLTPHAGHLGLLQSGEGIPARSMYTADRPLPG